MFPLAVFSGLNKGFCPSCYQVALAMTLQYDHASNPASKSRMPFSSFLCMVLLQTLHRVIFASCLAFLYYERAIPVKPTVFLLEPDKFHFKTNHLKSKWKILIQKSRSTHLSPLMRKLEVDSLAFCGKIIWFNEYTHENLGKKWQFQISRQFTYRRVSESEQRRKKAR